MPQQVTIPLPATLVPFEHEVVAELRRHGYQLAGLPPLGSGNFGSVLLAHKRGQLVAVKVSVTADITARRFAQHEGDLAMRLGAQRHVVGALEHWPMPPDLHFLVMPFIHGANLGDWLSARQPGHWLEEERLCDWLEQVLIGVKTLHAVGIIHRDLKPDNLLLSSDERGVWIADLNIAKDARAGTLAGQKVLGTPGYAAPEQYRGETSILSDLYAVGMIAYTLAVLDADPKRAPERIGPLFPCHHNPTLSRHLEAWIERAAALDPAQRFASAEEALQALRATTSPATPVAPPPKTPKHACPSCGAGYKQGELFCEQCGAALVPTSPGASPVQPVTGKAAKVAPGQALEVSLLFHLVHLLVAGELNFRGPVLSRLETRLFYIVYLFGWVGGLGLVGGYLCLAFSGATVDFWAVFGGTVVLVSAHSVNFVFHSTIARRGTLAGVSRFAVVSACLLMLSGAYWFLFSVWSHPWQTAYLSAALEDALAASLVAVFGFFTVEALLN